MLQVPITVGNGQLRRRLAAVKDLCSLHFLYEKALATLDCESWESWTSPRSFDWGRGGFIGTQTHIPTKFSFSSDFCHFILKMLKNAKKNTYVSRKKSEISLFLGGRPRCFQKFGDPDPRDPPPPIGDAPGGSAPKFKLP